MTRIFEKAKVNILLIAAAVVFAASLMFSNPAPAVITNTATPEEQVTTITNQPSAHDRRQMQCLAENAYFEAGNQSRRGMIAVSNVVMNRARDNRFPSSPCGVIYQRTGRSCQFSWVCSRNKRIRESEIFAQAKDVAEDVYYGRVGDITRGSKFYHAVYVNPQWRLRRLLTIGDHVFYGG